MRREALRYRTEPRRGPEGGLLAEGDPSAGFAVITLDAGGLIGAWGPGAERLLGYTAEEVLGQPLTRFWQGQGPHLTGGGDAGDATVRRKDGTRLRCSYLASGTGPRPDSPTGYTVALKDQSEQEQARRALEASENRFRAVIEKSWDAVALLDPDGSVRYASPSTARILGYGPAEFVGRNLFDLMHPDDRQLTNDHFTRVVQTPGDSLPSTFRFRHQDGSWRWLESIFTNLLDEPDVGAVVANYHDVSEHKRMEEALRERAEKLAEADRRKDHFLAMLAHELRNPLAPVLNGLHILRLSASDADTVEQARAIMERQVRHMARLVDDLLDVSRITRNKIVLRQERLDLGRLVRTSAEDFRGTLEQGGLAFTVEVPETPVWVVGDATRLNQVVDCLLDNAAKFSDRGGAVAVRLHVDPDARQAVLGVKDTGIGLDPEMLPVLFDAFAQADRSLERTRGGLGMGLALVKGLVQLHGGEVRAHSEGPGKGAEFVVRLPCEGEPAALAEMPEAPPAPTHERLRILIVEDNRDAANSLRMLLELHGHEVRVAYSGPEGVKAASAWGPDIVLCDIGLPGLDGFGVAGALRRNPLTARARIIAITGYGREQDRQQSREVGFDHHLTKPVDPNALVKLLSE